MLTNEARTSVLATVNIVPGPGGYDLDVLERFARERGWICTVVPGTTSHGRTGRWKASVYSQASEWSMYVSRWGARGSGQSEAEALARALATMLAREG